MGLISGLGKDGGNGECTEVMKLQLMATVTSPKSSFCKISLCPKQKPLKVMVLGQSGVGKSALVVRFITKRFIGEYDPTLEKTYSYSTVIDNEMVYFEILDTAGQPHEAECLTLEPNIRWAEAFILMYSVTDKCSFDECNRLKFLINYNKRRRRLVTNSTKEALSEVPVVLVGNKADQSGDRMVSLEDGQRRSREIGCVCFHEISVRESIEQVWCVFRDVCQFWRVHTKFPKIKRSSSEMNSPELPLTPHQASTPNGRPFISVIFGRRWTEVELDEEEEEKGVVAKNGEKETESELLELPFRGRASTDGNLIPRPSRLRHPPLIAQTPTILTRHNDRRMSISMRGNNASY